MSGAVKWYAAASLEGVRTLADVEVVDLPGLRDPSNGAEHIILYHPDFAEGAERLAEIRRAQPGWGGRPVLLVDLYDVFDEFSWGMIDAVAIRNFLAYAHDEWIGHAERPLYAVFIGDAAYDTKRFLDGSPPNLFTSYVGRYRTENRLQYDADLNLNFYSTDDYFGYLEPEDYMKGMQAGLDVSIGRFPVSSPEDLDIMLDKLEVYTDYENPGQWQNRVILTADDERVLDPDDREPVHTQQIEELSRFWLPPPLDRVKVYLTEFPRNDFGKKPEAQDKFVEEFTRGALMVTYTGHGDQNTMAQEEVFVSSKIPELLNEDRLPVFSTFSCTVSRFDLISGNTMTELLLFYERGGAVISFASGGLVFRCSPRT